MKYFIVLIAVILLQYDAVIAVQPSLDSNQVCLEVAKSIIHFIQKDRESNSGTHQDGDSIAKTAKFVTFRAIDRNIYRKVKQMLMNTSIVLSGPYSADSYKKLLNSKVAVGEAGDRDYIMVQNAYEKLFRDSNDADSDLNATPAPNNIEKANTADAAADEEADKLEPEDNDGILLRAKMLNRLKEITLDIIEEFEAMDVHRYVHEIEKLVKSEPIPSVNEIKTAIEKNCKATAQAGTIFAEVFFTAAKKIDKRSHNGQLKTYNKLKIFWHGEGVSAPNYNKNPKTYEDLKIYALFRYIKTELDWRDSSQMRDYFKHTRETLVKINKHKNKIETIGEQPKATDITGISIALSELDTFYGTLKDEVKTPFSGQLARHIMAESIRNSPKNGVATLVSSASKVMIPQDMSYDDNLAPF